MGYAKNLLKQHLQQQIDASLRESFCRQQQVTLHLARRLGLEKELEGHSGCVNCLEWTEDGQFLASGSDDFDVILWDMLWMKEKIRIPTGHVGNIFAVKFLPHSGNTMVACGAADALVKILCTTTAACTQTFSCHLRRVKRLSTSRLSPFLLWSGSEDGTVRQFDLRESHVCASTSRCSNVIINLAGHIGPASEVKCIQVHPLYPEYIAVGGSDPYLRLYDLRMLYLSDTQDSKAKVAFGGDQQPPRGCVSYFAPGHVVQRANRLPVRNHRQLVTTYAAFSPDGQQLLQNLGGEHIYLYSFRDRRPALVFSGLSSHDHAVVSDAAVAGAVRDANGIVRGERHEQNGRTSRHAANGYAAANSADALKPSQLGLRACGVGVGSSEQLTPRAADLKVQGNDAFSKEKYFEAVLFYNKALLWCPRSAVLLANRAAALMKRGWDGDMYCALRDCYEAVLLDPTHSKAFYRQAKCLLELRWYDEAFACVQLFKRLFPGEADGYAIKKLEMDIVFHKTSARNDDVEEDNASGSSGDGETPRQRRRVPQSASSETELLRRERSYDFDARFVGACNTTTDIKEANFFGGDGQFVVAGSDCGCMLLWDAATTNLVQAWKGDESIVNCLQPHPTTCMLATSGIDPVVRLWSPRCSQDSAASQLLATPAQEIESLVRANQKRMNADPLEVMLLNMGYRPNLEESSDDDHSVQCRTS